MHHMYSEEVVRRLAEKVLRDHHLDNTTSRYEKFIKLMCDDYRATYLSVAGLESAIARRLNIMYPTFILMAQNS